MDDIKSNLIKISVYEVDYKVLIKFSMNIICG